MIEPLPKPIADYIEANARLDAPAMLAPFAADALVRDDGGHHRGRAALQTWIQDATIANRAVFTPDAVSREQDQVLLSGLTHGDFRGSPVRFTLRFTLDGDAIRALEIAS